MFKFKNIPKTAYFIIIIMLIVFSSVRLFAQTDPSVAPIVQPCPCNSLSTGYYYTGQYYQFKPVLFSNMPIDQFVGYTIMDSIITYARTAYPTAKTQKEFINGLTCEGDTLKYALKYLYRLADYNPFLYYNFLTSYQEGKQQPMILLSTLLERIKQTCGLPTQEVIKAEYILHLKVNKVEPFNYNNGTTNTTLIYVYNQVIDTIKGQVLPYINNAIEVFTQDSLGSTVKKSKILSIPSNTNFIYYYNPNWGMPIKEEVDSEYIVFSWALGSCVNRETGYQYYDIRPTTLDFQDGIFPIVNGNVLDKGNDFGWGTSVPVETFKQNLQDLIDSIRNYGE